MNKVCKSKVCKITGIILAVIAVTLTGIFLLASQKSDDFKVTRSVVINAPPEIIFPWVNNLQNGQRWSPWVEMDPDAAFSFEGPIEGAGAIIHWNGKKSGTGTMTITESVLNEKVVSRLDFKKPMESIATADYALTPTEGGTMVTWGMYSKNNFLNKVMSVFMDCEKMVGNQFDKGLANLKKIVEAE